MINTWAWCGWLLAGLVALSITRNPTYLLILFLVITLVSTVLVQRTGARKGFFSPLHFLVFISLTASVFNALISHFGNTVLFTIPGQIPLISGAVTLEALIYGALNGLVLSGLFVIFMVINQALPVRALIRLIPRAFASLAVVISIAVTFIPSTRRQFDLIREAQAVRGHRVRGIRDALPLIMPLLVGGLERAFQLAEAMTARGFGGQAETERYGFRSRFAMLAGLLLVLAGWLLILVIGSQVWGGILIAAGVALILGMFILISSHSTSTTYRTESWSIRDGIVLAGAALMLVVFLIANLSPWQFIQDYNPYPVVTIPTFNPWVGFVILALLLPAFLVDPVSK
ncbi:MAG: energy-coupling factor transporter transmembrane component T [Negativicutes bacterium]|nr:energy-coupling factor transporter transmembrane component T [Negativicutes bacterium]